MNSRVGDVVYAALLPSPSVWAAACWVAGLVVLARLDSSLRGTTLVAPCRWFGGSLTCLCLVEIWLAFQPAAAWHSHLRYAAAATTFWPLVALLGARRPQDRAWQLIVLSLWVVLLLPAAEGILFAPETPLRLWGVWQIFVLGLVTIGLLNWLPTRRWPMGVALTAGRLLLLAPSFSWGRGLVTSSRLDTASGGLVLLVTGLVFAAVLWPRRRPAYPIDRVWLDFRDAYGLLWGLRVADRFNAAARQLHWGIRLRWRGLDSAEGARLQDLPLATRDAARGNLEMLLRRFVSPEWFTARWDEQVV